MRWAIDMAAEVISSTTLVTCDGKTPPQNMAKAVLAAVREPTPEMIEAGAKAHYDKMKNLDAWEGIGQSDKEFWCSSIALAWRAMHDAMMKE